MCDVGFVLVSPALRPNTQTLGALLRVRLSSVESLVFGHADVLRCGDNA